jgi:hypothetical protein
LFFVLILARGGCENGAWTGFRKVWACMVS